MGGTIIASDFDIQGRILSPLPTRDSVLPILPAFFTAARRKQTLSQLAASYILPFTAADRLENFDRTKSAALMARLHHSDYNLQGFFAPLSEVIDVNKVNGLRVTLAEGEIVHVRTSVNAPEMRCYVEARTEQAAMELLQQTAGLIRQWAESSYPDAGFRFED
ncbi:hypothetical protein E2F50_06700 [Rhizobium deserti]|uniref:Alpha-D-phosphohexomutase C-terminal domain-containing protein n=1 Tax=Rhizobium deserti TaxID=2547961 RepID=A0A4R5UIG9_9HYPH|nr:hypothetical protein [Rhizobium deserti]TDK36611.1 hypothetical protein E2F50_06700 [Rhizobium deserti]